VTTVHELQYAVIKRLDSHAYAVHAQSKKSFDIFFSLLDDIFRIDLNGEFIERTSMSRLRESGMQILKNRKGQHRWGAASYIQCIYMICDLMSTHHSLLGQSLGIAVEKIVLTLLILCPTASGGDLRIEVAICAETPAERDVDVYHGLSEHQLG